MLIVLVTAPYLRIRRISKCDDRQVGQVCRLRHRRFERVSAGCRAHYRVDPRGGLAVQKSELNFQCMEKSELVWRCIEIVLSSVKVQSSIFNFDICTPSRVLPSCAQVHSIREVLSFSFFPSRNYIFLVFKIAREKDCPSLARQHFSNRQLEFISSAGWVEFNIFTLHSRLGEVTLVCWFFYWCPLCNKYGVIYHEIRRSYFPKVFPTEHGKIICIFVYIFVSPLIFLFVIASYSVSL